MRRLCDAYEGEALVAMRSLSQVVPGTVDMMRRRLWSAN